MVLTRRSKRELEKKSSLNHKTSKPKNKPLSSKSKKKNKTTKKIKKKKISKKNPLKLKSSMKK